jgi:hypothetical protein
MMQLFQVLSRLWFEREYMHSQRRLRQMSRIMSRRLIAGVLDTFSTLSVASSAVAIG